MIIMDRARQGKQRAISFSLKICNRKRSAISLTNASCIQQIWSRKIIESCKSQTWQLKYLWKLPHLHTATEQLHCNAQEGIKRIYAQEKYESPPLSLIPFLLFPLLLFPLPRFLLSQQITVAQFEDSFFWTIDIQADFPIMLHAD